MCSVLTWNRVTMRSGCRTSEVPLYRDLENHVMHLMQGMHSWTDTVGSGQVNHVYLPGAMGGRCRTSDLPLCRDMEHDVMQGSMGEREHPPKKHTLIALAIFAQLTHVPNRLTALLCCL